jgi:uncharacterized pyridoxal phosphate-containing UPF0001 family protein
MSIIENFRHISSLINSLSKKTKLIVVTKNQDQNIINELVETNHINFGENRVQEAINKWSNIINFKKNIKLHLIGKIQSNKVKQAFNIFDYIHSLDSLKIAEIFSKLEMNGKKKIKYFIQVNLAKESQKGGVYEEYLVEFLNAAVCLLLMFREPVHSYQQKGCLGLLS